MRAVLLGLALAALVLVIAAGRGWTSRTSRSADASPAEAISWDVETVAQDLKVPWALAFSRDGRLFFTERQGRISVIGKIGERPRTLVEIPEVVEGAPGQIAEGLLGLALDPFYPEAPYLYVYYTYLRDGRFFNRLVRFQDRGHSATVDRVLVDEIPGSSWQNGGRIAFGPDGKLYVPTGGGHGGPKVTSVGTVSLPSLLHVIVDGDREAQNLDSVAGKILRLNRDGSIPVDNPFPRSPVYSYGHRHSQGLAWHPTTEALYITEHGPPGGWDELNRVEAGRNYGWPRFKGYTASIKLGFVFFTPEPYAWPVAVYTPAIAPSGASFYRGDAFPRWKNNLFFATLAGQHLHRLELSADGARVAGEERLLDGTYGRLRAVVEGPDGFLYVSTSNHDKSQPPGPGPHDDRILRIVPRSRHGGAR